MIQDSELYALAIRSTSKVTVTWRSSSQADEPAAPAADRVRDGVQGGGAGSPPGEQADHPEAARAEASSKSDTPAGVPQLRGALAGESVI